ncbi:hypothetical protein J3R30DRAFT_3449115 [Lentinula aciculospora]|uniref:F-box domain-containing protein n=1 Tax=Lentinula aciculospora TaxID=153920 RepID=A0A9W9DSI5_9AGAR|nr:hypothetical protein J3R30DRAFT_3449115 [Lentinula aciculospora]
MCWRIKTSLLPTRMSFIQLPDDILINVLSFLSPPEILLLRKTCKQLQALTLERTIWSNVYRNSGYFLPPGPTASQTINELERVLLHAYRWDPLWADLAHLQKRNPRPLKSDPSHVRNLVLYQGKYLAVGVLDALILYDLHTGNEIFRHDIPTIPVWLCPQNHPKGGDANCYIPFASTLLAIDDGPAFELRICEIDTLGNATIHALTDIRLNRGSVVGVGYDFFVTSHGLDNISLLHIPSQNRYILNAKTPIRDLTNVIFLPGHVVLILTEYENRVGKKYFELYRLPDFLVMKTGSCLSPTHRETISMHFTEASLFSSDTSLDGRGTVWLVILAGIQLWPLRINLQPDGSMAFYKPEYDAYRFTEPLAVHAYDFHFTVTSTTNGLQGRGISKYATPKLSWLKYDVCWGRNGNVTITMSALENDILPDFLMYDFDAYRGLFCGTSYSETISVLDLVS